MVGQRGARSKAVLVHGWQAMGNGHSMGMRASLAALAAPLAPHLVILSFQRRPWGQQVPQGVPPWARHGCS